VEAHLAACPACAEEWAFGETLAAELALLQTVEPPRVDVTDRVMERVASLPLPSAPRAALGTAWPWAAAAAAGLLMVLAATGWMLGPAWLSETARLGGRLVARVTAALPTWLAAGEALLRAARSLSPDAALLTRAGPFLAGTASFFCAVVLAASIALAGREWRAARRRSGVRS
jgi:hypothetical protein